MVNKAMVLGRVGKDCEQISGGPAIFSVATTAKWTSDGEKKEKTTWHSINAWGKLGENCSQYVKKGMLVYVEGAIDHQEWQDDQGQKKSRTVINAQTVQFLSKPSEGGSGGF